MTLLLTGSDVARLLPMDRCIEAVEHAFRTLAAGKLPPPGVLATHVEGGGFHVKAAVLDGCYAAKINANFPANPERGLPTIQGVVLLSDAVDGRPLAIMDSIEITARRTAVGADNPDKSEIAPPLMAEAKVVADVLEQAAAIGDLRHAIAARAMTISDVHAELADVLSGRRPGRDSVDDITIFDSTGTAIQDVAAAALVYRRAAADGAARSVTIAA